MTLKNGSAKSPGMPKISRAPCARSACRSACATFIGSCARRVLSPDDAPPHLIALERLEQRFEIALAESLVALALDELEEHGAEERLREDLQQQALAAAFGRAVEQDAARAEVGDVLAVTGQALVEHLVIRVRGRLHERYAARAEPIEGVEQIVGEQRDVLDALAVEAHQEL